MALSRYDILMQPTKPISGQCPANICSKSTIETLEKGLKYVQS